MLVMCSYTYIRFSSLFCLYLILMPAIQLILVIPPVPTALFQKVLYFLMRLIHFPQSTLISSATSSNAAPPSFCLALRTFQIPNFLTGYLHFNSSTSSTFSCVIGTTNTNTGSSLDVCSNKNSLGMST